MREQVAVERHTLQEAPGNDGRRGASHRPAGRRFLLLVLLACAGVLALGAGSAQAFQSFSFQFGGTGAGAGQFNSPQGVAVHQGTGDVYVVDGQNFRVEKFTPTSSDGGFDLAFGAGVNSGSGNANICTTDCQAGTQGTSAGSFEQPTFIAVDNSGGSSDGDVYVADPGDNTVSKFDSNGNLVSSWAGTGQLSGTGTSTFASIDGLAVDSAGDVLVIDGNSTVWEFSGSSATMITSFSMGRGTDPAGLAANGAGNLFKVNGDGSVEETTATGDVIGTINEATTSTTDIAIDPGSGDLYQDLGTTIDHYHFDGSGNVVDAGGPCPVVESGSCVPTDSFGTGHLTAGTGLAYDSTESTLYAADGSNEVEVFGPPEPGAPSVDSTTSSNVGSTTATLNAQVNPFDNDTTCQFQYISDSDFMADGGTFGAGTQTAACNPADLGTGFNDVGATADISGLTINTTYDFRVVATNSAAPSGVDGPTEQFMTLGAALIDSLGTSNIGAESVELDAQINPLGTDSTCVFNIIDDSSFQNDGNVFGAGTTQLPCNPADLGAGSSDVAASAQATGLTPGTTYDFEVVVTNTLGTVTEASQVQTTPPLVIDSESVTHVSQTSAHLSANVNPDGLDTKVKFQFETDATFNSSPAGDRFENATTVPASGIDIGSGTADVTASVDLVGLTPGTTYHFRAVGTNTAGTEDGAAKEFATFAGAPTSGLPDGRAYEMVTPVNKADGEIFSNELISGDQSSLNGNSVAYVSLTSFPGSTGPGVNYIATRGASGWTTKTMLPPQAAGNTLELPGYSFFSSDLSSAVLANGDSNSGGGQDSPPIVPGEPIGPLNLFLRNNANGAFQLVNVTPASATAADAHFDNGSSDGSTVVFDETAALTAGASPTDDNLFMYSSATHQVTLLGTGAVLGASGPREVNAVSSDGKHIFFTNSSGDLEVFENGSATQVAAATSSATPSYQEALTDGSAVFFTDDASAGLPNTTAGSGANLYEFDTANGEVTNLTANQANATVDGVVGVGGTAGNSFEYFVAEGAFGGAPASAAGGENLYVVHGGAAKFIATLNGSDGNDWNGQYTARVTPDGAHLAFDSTNPLTGFDNTDMNTGAADTEIFLYDATTNKLACASCSPAGNQPIGSSQLDPVQGGLLSGGNTFLSHQLSDDGSRLFFDSNGALVQNDNNGAQDVYEFENGQDRLISTGTSSSNSIFLDASASGNDVFFVTRDQLVPQDTDGGNDLYDARVNGGFPVPAPNPPCTGDGCKPPTTAPPAPPTTATVTFAGPSNPSPKSSKSSKKPKAAKVRFSTKVMKGFRFSISVRVPANGKVKVWGAGLKTVSRSVNGGRSYKLTVALNGAQRKALRKKHKGRMRLTVHIDYKMATGQSSTAIVPVTVQA